MMGWSEMQLMMDRRLRCRTCRFQADCEQGLNCPYEHSDEVLAIFEAEKQLKQRKLMVRCGFCVRGECRHGDSCWRGSGGYVPSGPTDSDYGSVDSSDRAGSADGSDGSALDDSDAQWEQWDGSSDDAELEEVGEESGEELEEG